MATAADSGIYLGVGASRDDFDYRWSDKQTSRNLGFKLIAGYRPFDNLGFEANYSEPGKDEFRLQVACPAMVGVICPSRYEFSARTTSAYAVGFLDLPFVDLFAKAGLAVVQVTLRAPEYSLKFADDSSTSFAWGGGAQLHFGSLGARVEYEQFTMQDARKLGVVSVSLLYTFL